jgi:hypothetical protein
MLQWLDLYTKWDLIGPDEVTSCTCIKGSLKKDFLATAISGANTELQLIQLASHDEALLR